MAVTVNVDKLPEGSKADAKPETKFIRAGNRLARVVSYVELGKHFQRFQGKNAVYDSGNKKGQEKPPVLHLSLTFEFPNEEHTGEYPLTLETSIMFKPGEFLNSLTVPDSLADGTMSKKFALKTRFMKYLGALQDATGETFQSLAEFAKIKAGVMINVTNTKGKGENKDKVYANMKPEGIMIPEMTHPVTGDVEKFPVPEQVGEYCPVYDWDAPTPEAWKELKPWHQKIIQSAMNFVGSPTHTMITADPELIQKADEEVSDESVSDTQKEVHRIPTDEDIPV